jgi:hypothetical protein
VIGLLRRSPRLIWTKDSFSMASRDRSQQIKQKQPTPNEIRVASFGLLLVSRRAACTELCNFDGYLPHVAFLTSFPPVPFSVSFFSRDEKTACFIKN